MNLERGTERINPGIDKILDKTQEEFSVVFQEANAKRRKLHKKLLTFIPERYRWDEPAISFTWVSNNINRSVVADVDGRTVNVEINAWKDAEEGGTTLRNWNNKLIGNSASGTPREHELLRMAFQKVSSWKLSDLNRENPLSRGAGN